MTAAGGDTLRVRVHDASPETEDIRLLDLRVDAGELPPFTPGAHGPSIKRTSSSCSLI